MFYVLIN